MGRRQWGVSWIPLISTWELFGPAERARRLRLYCDAYGLKDRRGVLETMRLRIEHVARFIDEEAQHGDPGFVKLVGWETPARMRRDIASLDEHRGMFERALA